MALLLDKHLKKEDTRPQDKSFLVEIFSAIQGEGPIVGQRQIFIRYLGCHIACAYCDTPATHTKQRHCRIEKTPGQRDFYTLPNPLMHEDLERILLSLETFQGLHDGVSLTGGEPLQHIRSLKGLIPILKRHGFPIYLETDGILHRNLTQCIEDLDLIGMDMKLPSATLLRPYWEEHAQFLQVASQQEVFVKLVVSGKTPLDEIQQAIDIVKGVDKNIPMILQPVTPYGAVRQPPTPAQILSWQALAKKQIKQVRVVPQTHKLIGQL